MLTDADNSYAFATSSSEDQVPSYKLYDSRAVAVASFLGGPIPGTVLMAINYRRLGYADKAVLAILAGLSTLGLGFALTSLFPNGTFLAVGIGLSTATWWLAEKLQGQAIDEHVNRGGPLGSGWMGGLLGTIFMLVAAGLVFLPGIISPKVTVGTNLEIYYSHAATRQDAQALGDALTKIGFAPASTASIFLSKDKSEGTVVSFVLQDGFWNRPGVAWSFENIGRGVAPAIGGLPVKVRLINNKKEVQKELVVGQAGFGKDNIYYLGSATVQEANALGQSLKTSGYFLNRGFDVFLSKENGDTTVTFVANRGWDEPAQMASYNAIVRDAAPAIGGLPVKVRVADTELEPRNEMVIK